MATLRVISGSAKGKRLKTVPGDSTRPITDQVKEALFNILADEVLDIDILDLFGGTGAVGIEALSRGANSVLFWIPAIKPSRSSKIIFKPQNLANKPPSYVATPLPTFKIPVGLAMTSSMSRHPPNIKTCGKRRCAC